MMTTDNISLEPRHFWRRAFAFVLDSLLTGVIAGFVLLPISMALGIDLGAPGVAKVSRCETAAVTLPVVQAVDRLWPLAIGEARTGMICHVSLLGVPGRDIFYTTTTSSSETEPGPSGNDGMSLSAGVDADGNVVSVADYPDLGIPLMVAILAWFIINGRRSPGKLMLSLKVSTAEGASLGWAAALLREALKNLPFLAVFVSQVYTFAVTPAGNNGLVALIAAVRGGGLPLMVLVGPVLVLIWWFGPFLFWRGATWYDRIAGTKVIGISKR